MSAAESLPTELLASVTTVFRNNKQWADKAIAQLTDEQLRTPPHPEINSIAVIMKHVAGNLLSRFTDFLTSDGEKPWRHRDEEFVDTFADRAELLAYWERGWDCLFATLESLTADDVAKTVTIRGEPHSVPLALQRSVGHCGYHVGQIVLLARLLVGDHPWQTITIPRGGSTAYNSKVWGQGHYGK